MAETTTTPLENRIEAVHLIELAHALLTGADTEMAGLLLTSAVEALTAAEQA